MTHRPIVVTIDEVRLHGFDPRARYAIGDALSRTLTRLFAADSPAQARRVARADAGTFAVRRDASADTLGAHIGARVYRAVRRPC